MIKKRENVPKSRSWKERYYIDETLVPPFFSGRLDIIDKVRWQILTDSQILIIGKSAELMSSAVEELAEIVARIEPDTLYDVCET